MRIDGDLSEWKGVEPIALKDPSQGVDDWRDPEDLAARAYVMWDASHLYFACDVDDDVLQQPGLGSGLWSGDAIQMAFDLLHDASDHHTPDDFNFAFALTTDGPALWYYVAPEGGGRDKLEDVQLQVVKKPGDKGYIYEMAIPWRKLSPLVPLAMEDCGFSFVVADNDGEGFKGGLQWTKGIWHGQSPAAFGDLIFKAIPPPKEKAEVFIGTDKGVIKEDEEVRIRVAINSARSFTRSEIKARVLSGAGKEISQITERLDVEEGVTRVAMVWPAQEQPAGDYALDLGIYNRKGELLGEKMLSFFLVGDLISTVGEKLEKIIQEIKVEAKSRGNPLLGLRALDVERRKAEGIRLLDEAVAKAHVELALPIVEEGETIGRLFLKEEPSPASLRYPLMRLTGDVSAETVWETSVGREGNQQLGIYYAGIPIGHVEYSRFSSPEELDRRLEGWLSWYREQGGYQIVEKAIGEYEGHVVTEEEKLQLLVMVKGVEQYRIRAVNEEVGWKLAEELVSLDGISSEEVEEMHATMEPNPGVDVEHVSEILGFEFASSSIVVGEKAGKEELALAERLAAELGGDVLSEGKVLEPKDLVVVGTRESSGLIKAYEADGTLSYPHADQGLLTYRGTGDRQLVFVAGREGGSVIEAGNALVDLVTVMKERQFLVGDLHMHTTHSDGVSPPFIVATATMRNYMDFAAVTDHNTPAGSLEAIQAFAEAGIDYTLIPGQEVTTGWAHLVAVGCEDTISWEVPPEEVMRSVHAAGGLVIVAHPGYPESEWSDRALADWLASGVDGFETRSRTPEFYPRWKKLERLPSLVSSTDSHSTMFSYPVRTLVFARENTPEEILEAVRGGYCLGYTLDEVYGPELLRNVFRTLLEEGEYLKSAHVERLRVRVNSLYADLP